MASQTCSFPSRRHPCFSSSCFCSITFCFSRSLCLLRLVACLLPFCLRDLFSFIHLHPHPPLLARRSPVLPALSSRLHRPISPGGPRTANHRNTAPHHGRCWLPLILDGWAIRFLFSGRSLSSTRYISISKTISSVFSSAVGVFYLPLRAQPRPTHPFPAQPSLG